MEKGFLSARESIEGGKAAVSFASTALLPFSPLFPAEMSRLTIRAGAIPSAAPQTMKLLDFGYQGKSLDDLRRFLRENKVDVLVDVRENAVRVRKFKKTALESLCRALGVTYIWARELGNPFRHENRWQEAYEAYLNHSEAARKRIEELKRLLLDGKTLCLLCYEQNPNACHRTLVKKLLLRLDPFPF